MAGTRKALVVGGAVAGLCAAAALRERFDEVIVLEKDALSPETTARKGVAQGTHLHSLLMGAEVMLEGLFPGIRGELLAAGAVQLRAGLDQQVFEAGSWMPERDLGLTILAQSRGLLERTIRRRVASLPGVQIRPEAKVLKITPTDEGGAVRLTVLQGSPESEQALVGDLLVDATGRSGTLVRKLGLEVPEEEVASRIVYVSAHLQKPEVHLGRKENILIIPEPSHSAGGALLDIEGDRWVVSLHGRNGKAPPLTLDAWKEYARGLPDDRIWQRIREATLEGKLAIYNKPTSTFRRFDRAEALPRDYFPVGDVISSVNPIFGQGMAVALGHVHALRAALRAPREEWQRLYLEGACSWSNRAWRRALAYDRTFLFSEQEQARNLAALRALARARQQKAHGDPATHRAMVIDGQMYPDWATP